MSKILTNKKLLSLVILVIVIIVMTFFLIPLIKKSSAISDFRILNVESIDGSLTVICENQDLINTYNVTVKDASDNTLLEQSSNTNHIDISSLQIAYQETVYITVLAKNNHEEKISSNTFEYTSNNPSFNSSNSHIITTNQTLNLKIDGDLVNNRYHLVIKYRDLSIYKADITSNNLKIPYDYLSGYNGRLTAYIYNEDNRIVNQFNFYNNPVLVGNVYITSPADNTTMTLDDININYQGGENATKYQAKLYKGSKLLGTFPAIEDVITIPASNLSANTTYRIVLEAIYQDYDEIAQTSAINITVTSQEKTSPVTVNHNYKNLKPGTKLALATRTNGATIKYTLNGKDPKKYGAVYTDPITITRDVTLKTVAIKNNQIDSVVTTYQVHVGHKVPTVYLSPSNQYLNIGIASVGYSNEMVEMNRIADYVEERLKASGITVLRNVPTDSMETWTYESLKAKADLHFAIHSNASGAHNTKGMEIFVDNENSTTMSMAANIYNNLYAIYPNKDSTTDRGIKYAEGRLGEVRTSNLPNGILIEIAHHDYPSDAKWLVDKRKEISYNIADSIIDYFQMN